MCSFVGLRPPLGVLPALHGVLTDLDMGVLRGLVVLELVGVGDTVACLTELCEINGQAIVLDEHPEGFRQLVVLEDLHDALDINPICPGLGLLELADVRALVVNVLQCCRDGRVRRLQMTGLHEEFVDLRLCVVRRPVITARRVEVLLKVSEAGECGTGLGPQLCRPSCNVLRVLQVLLQPADGVFLPMSQVLEVGLDIVRTCAPDLEDVVAEVPLLGTDQCGMAAVENLGPWPKQHKL